MLPWLPSLWEQQAAPLPSLSLCQACTVGVVFDLVPLTPSGRMEVPQVQMDHSGGESPFQKPWKVPGTPSDSLGPRPPPQPVTVRLPALLLHPLCHPHGTAGPALGPDGPTGPAKPRPVQQEIMNN